MESNMTSQFELTLPSIKVTGVAQDDQGNNWYQLKLTSEKGSVSAVVGVHLLDGAPDSLIKAARDLGYAVLGAEKDKLIGLVGNAINKIRGSDLPKFRVATKIGWTPDFRTFITPQECYGLSAEKPSAASLGVPAHADYSRAGDLGEWKKAFKGILADNPLFLFGSCIAFMPPLLALADMAGTTIVFTGETSTGRSTLINFIGSLRGGTPEPGLGFTSAFRTTANFLEPLAVSANDGVLTIDDIRAVPGGEAGRAKFIDEAIFLIPTGRTKGRLDGSGPPVSFRTVVVTSDNLSLKTLLSNGKVKFDESMEVRYIQIAVPFPNGVLHDEGLCREERDDQLKKIKRRSSRHCGVPQHEFLVKLLEAVSNDRKSFCSNLEERIRRQQNRLIAGDATNGAGRVSAYFGLAYAAGCFAIEHGILPVKKTQLRDAVALVYEMHLAAREDTQAANPVSLLREAIFERLDKFMALPKEKDDLSDGDEERVPGFRKGKKGDGDFVFTSAQFDKLMPREIIGTRMCEALKRRGLLSCDKGGKASAKNTKKVRIGGSRPRAYCISARILE
jgi:hypothetical protein